MNRCMNPSFAFFDLEMAGPVVSRSDECILRVWAKSADTTDFVVLVELNVNLRSLQFIGTTLENFHHPLPDNCVLVHLSDGIYTSFTDMPTDATTTDALRDAKSGSVEAGSSFDALMQLANLDECVQDALKVRARIENDVNGLLSKQSAAREKSRNLQAQKEQVSAAQQAAEAVRQQNIVLRKRNEELRQGLRSRRECIREDVEPSKDAIPHRQQQREQIMSLRSSIQHTIEESHGQARRIGEGLQTIFPIEPVGNKALQFTIRDIFLPNSTFDDTNRDEIAAALGFTAQLVHHLSLYLLCSLPYPLSPNASNSTVLDPVSAGLAQRRYPLYPTSVAYKFEYGVFLLNKDIEILMNKVGLRVLDIRHTLPNLKYLLYVLTAGSGELPARKAGGIKGLLGRQTTPSVSRRASDESVSHGRVFSNPNGTIGSQEKTEDPFTGSPPVAKFTFRPSNLREQS
jgi:UV radiation resistance-associated gene protein